MNGRTILFGAAGGVAIAAVVFAVGLFLGSQDAHPNSTKRCGSHLLDCQDGRMFDITDIANQLHTTNVTYIGVLFCTNCWTPIGAAIHTRAYRSQGVLE